MEDRGPALGQLDLPALVIHGERDPLVPLEAGRITADVIAAARLKVLRGAGHMFFHTNTWITLATELIWFLDEVGAGTDSR